MAQLKRTLRQPIFWVVVLTSVGVVLMVTAQYRVWSPHRAATPPSLQGKTNQPVAQPVQQAPAVDAPVIPTLRIRAEGPWIKVGQARNGAEGRALPIPWNQLVMLPVTPDNKAMWLEIAKLDPPPAANIPNVNPVQGWSGYIQEGNKLILYGVSNYR